MTQIDPKYGMDLESLRDVSVPLAPKDFLPFWQKRYDKIFQLAASPKTLRTGRYVGDFELHDLTYSSTDDLIIKGWLLTPTSQPVNKVIIVGHGYGGCEEPNFPLPVSDAAYLFPCFRGISLSRIKGVPENPDYHVLYHIDDRDKYILAGCVEDAWMAVSAAQALFPEASESIGFMGISFSGGIGALAMPCDKRIKRAHFQVPSFGHHPIRLQLPTRGSAHSVQNFCTRYPHVVRVLTYYDAAVAAQFIEAPVHIAAALADPVVAPPGQFAIYNALKHERHLYVLQCGHDTYTDQDKEQQALLIELGRFFATL